MGEEGHSESASAASAGHMWALPSRPTGVFSRFMAPRPFMKEGGALALYIFLGVRRFWGRRRKKRGARWSGSLRGGTEMGSSSSDPTEPYPTVLLPLQRFFSSLSPSPFLLRARQEEEDLPHFSPVSPKKEEREEGGSLFSHLWENEGRRGRRKKPTKLRLPVFFLLPPFPSHDGHCRSP